VHAIYSRTKAIILIAFALTLVGCNSPVTCTSCDPDTVHDKPQNSESRGELLYATHCGACHSTEIHWRERKLVHDWASLLVQVRRWQESLGLAWSRDEISDVARYLNATYYDFQAPPSEQRNLSEDMLQKQLHINSK
jgi:mono/diheme cytochrome c family protein